MSASNKKKLRKEQNMAALTEKQQKQRKEDKKLKAYTVSFIVVMVLILAITAGLLLRTPIAGMIDRNTIAVTVGDHKLSTTDLSYFYIDQVVSHYNKYVNQYGEQYAYMYAMLMEGVNFMEPLENQVKDATTGQTWADYYIDEAIKSARRIYGLYDKAVAEGFKLSEDTVKYYDQFEDYTDMYAKYYFGFSNSASYLRNYYGAGADIDTYKAYSMICDTASEYFNAHRDSLDFSDEDLRAFEKDKFDNYSSFYYNMFTITVSDYYEGGKEEKDETGKVTVTYTDAEKEAAREKAKADADALVKNESITDLKTFNSAIKELPKYKDSKTAEVSELKNVFYLDLTIEEMQKWMNDKERKAGDMTIIDRVSKSTNDKGESVDAVIGYYVVQFVEREDNNMKLQNVRHILIKFQGGKTDSTTGKTTYTEAEKNAAKEKAQKIKDEWDKLEKKTPEAFGDLAKEKTEDTGSKSTGGLYEDIYPGQMVEAFNDWCFDESRKAGDVDMVETEYGWHIIYYVGASDVTYRDSLLEKDLTTETMDKWEKAISDAVVVNVQNLKGLNRKFSVAG